MKSTGEVLGLGKTLNEALFKGLTSAGMKCRSALSGGDAGVLISVDTHDQPEVLSLAKKLYDLKFKLYATRETAETRKKPWYSGYRNCRNKGKRQRVQAS